MHGAEQPGEPSRSERAEPAAAELAPARRLEQLRRSIPAERSGPSSPGRAGHGRSKPSRSRRRRHARPPPDQPPVRGPFEPLVEHDRQTSAAASLSADHPATDPEGRPYEFPGLDDDEPAGSADAALDRLKELHRTAAAVAPQSLDAHFDQLLERQRRLISEYISEAEGAVGGNRRPR